MNYLVSAATDVGLVKDVNQDSFGVKILDTKLGTILVAVLCDGMGGYSSGEIASATVVDAFNKWMINRLPILCETGISDQVIKSEWGRLVQKCNDKIKKYGELHNISLGTTLTAIMLTETRWFIVNVGDSRVYSIHDQVKVLTKDQTVVAQEVELGKLTEEQAKTDPRRSVLLQCIGVSGVVMPDHFTGTLTKDTVYMLCSDGFRHEISNEEMMQYLRPDVMTNENQMKDNMDELVELNKSRKEKDNITVISIRTY
ncbi:MAG: serine/threonine-protein phosphatase [Ruminococcus sp.]|nr:serine/threonine-protein phosphatase [Ruminococcus sp.]